VLAIDADIQRIKPARERNDRLTPDEKRTLLEHKEALATLRQDARDETTSLLLDTLLEDVDAMLEPGATERENLEYARLTHRQITDQCIEKFPLGDALGRDTASRVVERAIQDDPRVSNLQFRGPEGMRQFREVFAGTAETALRQATFQALGPRGTEAFQHAKTINAQSEARTRQDVAWSSAEILNQLDYIGRIRSQVIEPLNELDLAGNAAPYRDGIVREMKATEWLLAAPIGFDKLSEADQQDVLAIHANVRGLAGVARQGRDLIREELPKVEAQMKALDEIARRLPPEATRRARCAPS
jgi:hypothetical protein